MPATRAALTISALPRSVAYNAHRRVLRAVIRNLLIAAFTLAAAGNAHAQWSNDANPVLAGRAGIGVAYNSTTRLRLAEDAGVLTAGPFQLTFGSTTAMWWAFRLDAANNLHLDRQTTGGAWAEGAIFDRDGDFGIGTTSPGQLLHATRDQNAGTYLQVTNGSNGAAAYAGLRMTEGATVKAEVSSASSGSGTPNEGPNTMRIMNYVNGPMVFATSGLERMRIFGTGNVSIGGPYNGGRFSVFEYGDGTIASRLHHDATFEATTPNGQNDYAALYTSMNRIPAGVTNVGSVIGGQFEAWKLMGADPASGSGNLALAIAGRFFVGTT